MDLEVAKEIAKNLTMGIATRLATALVTRTRRGQTDASALADNYDSTFEAYSRLVDKAVSGFSWHDREILEIGPGPALWTAVRFSIAGAGKVYCVDRFRRTQGDLTRRMYELLWGRLTDAERCALDDRLSGDSSGDWEFNHKYISYVRSPAETMDLPPVDFTCSWTVLEHVADVDAVIANLGRHTKPGGLGVHHIDMSAHWLGPADDPLHFLTYPDWLWWLMAHYQGAPNRVRFSRFERLFAQHGFELVEVLRKRELDRDYVEKKRKSLAPRFRVLETDDLALVSATCLVRKK